MQSKDLYSKKMSNQSNRRWKTTYKNTVQLCMCVEADILMEMGVGDMPINVANIL